MKLCKYNRPFLIITLLMLIGLPQTGHSSGETNGCHCFRNRTFNPADRFASDDYLLTTTFNSLLASEFNVSKRQIIMMKMREGIANNDLVTALYLTRTTGLNVSQLLEMKKKQTWKKIIDQLNIGKTSTSTDDLFHLITTGATDEHIAEHVTNRMIIERFAPAMESFELLRKNDFNSREIILVYTLAGHTGTPVQTIIEQNRKMGFSWSEIAHKVGMEPADVGKLLESTKDEK